VRALPHEREGPAQVSATHRIILAVSPLARPELIWSTENVAARLDDPQVRVVDCRFAFDRDMRREYVDGHIPGAVHVNWTTDLAAPPPASGHPRWMLSAPDDFARTMSRLGISNDTMVVGYDAEGGHHAARLWLGLRRYGHDACAIMEGGIQKWIREGRPLERGEVSVSAGTFVARPRTGVVATKEEVLDAVRRGDPWLLDVRRETEYTGEEIRSARGGHIPGAVNVLWKDALNDDWSLKDPDELEEMYTNAGFGPETSTVTYCQAGVRAAFTHLVLTALGHPDVRTYDGSWEEWGNDPTTPVVVGRS
jgi:thiosulfate/3-mercaptopyruvate sulfurtransferase